MDSVQHEATLRPNGLRRELHPIHIFAIAINAVIGMGFYIRVGVIEHLGGQAAVIYAYAFLGALSLMVTTCLAIMLRIWPIAGALVVFVERFVDRDIGHSVGILYWLTYCFAFAGLTTAIGQLVSYLGLGHSTSVFISVVSGVLPILFTLTDIQVFRTIQLILMAIKVSIIFAIIIIMNVINPQVGGLVTAQTPQVRSRDILFQHSIDESWFGILMASIFLASFSYVGIEVVAATAQEAKGANPSRPNPHSDGEEPILNAAASSHGPPLTHQDSENIAMVSVGSETILDTTAASTTLFSPHQRTSIDASTRTGSTRSDDENGNTFASETHQKSPFKSPATYVPIVSAMLYLWGAWVVTQDVAWDDQSQPSLAGSSAGWSNSIFINSAKESNVPGLDRALAALLIVNIVSTSSTALYVASRTLFGLALTITNDMERSPPSESWRLWWLQMMRILSRKSKFDVPYVTVLISAWGFILPFLKYAQGNAYLTAIDVVTEMGSVSCIFVWGWEAFAAYRFFRCCKLHPNALGAFNESKVHFGDNGWYYFHLCISMFASIMCLVIVIAGGAWTFLYNTNATQGIAAFLVVAVFIVLTLALKVIRWLLDSDPWWSPDRFLCNLNEGRGREVRLMFGQLDMLAAKHIATNHQGPSRSWHDFGGIIDSAWLSEKLM